MIGIASFGGFICSVLLVINGGWVGKDGEAVVRDTCLEVGAKEDIGGLEIAMDKSPCLVDVGEALCYILCYF